MRSTKIWLALACASLALASAAAAHPGHGLGGGSDSWLHYLTEPLHVAPPVLIALAVAQAWRRWRSARTR